MNEPIDDQDEHPSWAGSDQTTFGGLRDAAPERWQRWLVKLQFIKGGAKNWGTGFYINLNSSKHSVILTAGHNLIDETGTPVSDLKILQHDPQSDLIVHKDSIKICQDYEDDPSPRNRVNDYGAILLPLDNEQEGFGFAIKFGLGATIFPDPGEGSQYSDDDDERDRKRKSPVDVYVTGHRQQPNGEPAVAMTNSGPVKFENRNYLQYEVQTVTGNSGGPVWIPYRGFETVIGIHNYGPDSLKDRNALSQGTRLSLDVYRNICRWATIGWQSKSLKVCQSKAPPLGLYLRFSKHITFGRVRLGPEELDTKFDVVPGWTNSGVLDRLSMEFVFLFEEPSSSRDSDDESDEEDSLHEMRMQNHQGSVAPPQRFVRWKAELRKPVVELTEEFHDECLVQLHPKLKAYEIIRDYGEDRWKLRMEMSKIEMPKTKEEREGCWHCFESSEVGFARSMEKTSRVPYTLFGFE